VILGVFLFFLPSFLNVKLAFTSILIGLFMMFLVTERSIPQKMSDALVEGNMEVVRTITRELNLTGNATFLPKSAVLTEERVFIPLHQSTTVLPRVDDGFVFSTGLDGQSLGIAVPPSGLPLLKELEQDADFEHTGLDGVEEKLQTFVGFNLLRTVTLKQRDGQWDLILEKPLLCTNDTTLCRQFPCPTCSAALTALTRSSRQNVCVQDVTHHGKATTFHLKIGD